jgi:hypothetical protein
MSLLLFFRNSSTFLRTAKGYVLGQKGTLYNERLMARILEQHIFIAVLHYTA